MIAFDATATNGSVLGLSEPEEPTELISLVRAGSSASDMPPSSRVQQLSGVPYLVLEVGGSPQILPLPWTGEVLIGRSDSCHLVIASSSVSRVHARINVVRGEAAVIDLRSHNGTRVNGERLTGTRALEPRDVISVGNVSVTYHEARTRDGAQQSLQQEIAALTKRRINEALAATDGNQTHAARRIGMPLRTFISKLKQIRDGGEPQSE
jgi:hypothetical protein